MFLLLTQVLLWLLLTVILYNLLLKVIPRSYLTLLGGLFLFTYYRAGVFLSQRQTGVIGVERSLVPLKPVGASILLLSIALTRG
jgi:uncharacterized membrane protein